MSVFDGSGALGQMGILPHPVGTLDEIRKEGLDPANVPCCAPAGDGPNRIPGVRGCAVHNECPFHLKKYNFGMWTKGEGPHYVGYRLITDEGHKAENDLRCFDFVKTMLGRMRHGERLIEEGKRGERIRIIAQEGPKGGVIRTRTMVRKNPLDKSPNPEFEFKVEERPIHIFPRPGENPMLTYDQMLTASERRAHEDEQRHDEAFAAPIDYSKEEDWSKGDVEKLPEPSTAVPVAQPVEKRKP